MLTRLTARVLGLLLILLSFALFSGQAHAHQSSFTYASMTLADDANSVSYEVRVSTKDLFEALQLSEDRDATDDEIRSGAEKLKTYVFERISIVADAPRCQSTLGGVDIVVVGDRFAQLSIVVQCQGLIAKVHLDYDLFFDIDPRHEGLLRVDGALFQLVEAKREFTYDTGRKPQGTATGFLRSGIDHVLYGLDHILFLVALLLVVCLRQEGPHLRARKGLHSLRRTGGIVTAFTIGHSLTLLPAALGWITLPSRFVESMIAASIVFVAVENLIRPDPPRRYLVTFSFGLMHGLGFAAMLRPLLPPGDTILPLLLFNLGVELGQLAIVAGCLPILLILVQRVGVPHYRQFVLPAGCLLLSAIGLVWLAERALEIEIPGI